MLKIDWHLNSCWKGKHSQPNLAWPKPFIFHTPISKQVQNTEQSFPHRVFESPGTPDGSSQCNCSWVSSAVTCLPGWVSSPDIVVIKLETFFTKGNYEGWVNENKNLNSEKNSTFKLEPLILLYIVLKAELTDLWNCQTDQCTKTSAAFLVPCVDALAHCSFSTTEVMLW